VVLGRMEMISWTDRVRNEEVLHKAKKETNVLYTVNGSKAIGFVTSCVGTDF
jgi:hypothetical protein